MNIWERIKALPSRFRTFSGDVRTELKKTSWPSRKEVYGTTLVVILAVFFFGVYLFFVDLALQHVVQRIIEFF
ncbi:MAG: preprotein translocase subunit SecE [Acidobacteria bacterium]|nr:preprotein translocase subunit SecE [Acidobacteriota bacterium]